jgi:hypothetical protein
MRLWTIRNEQLAALQAAHERKFADRAVAHVKREHPAACSGLDEAAIRGSVETALRSRWEYRFDSAEAVFFWLDLMYLLGFEFDRDPRHAWAREQLTDYDLPERTRLGLLVEQARARQAAARPEAAP